MHYSEVKKQVKYNKQLLHFTKQLLQNRKIQYSDELM